jgi:hypothetical protein
LSNFWQFLQIVRIRMEFLAITANISKNERDFALESHCKGIGTVYTCITSPELARLLTPHPV